MNTGMAGQRRNDELFSFERLAGTNEPDSSMLLVNTEAYQRGCEALRFVPPLLLLSTSIPVGAGQRRGDLLLPVSSNHWAMHLSVQLFPEAVAKASVSRVRAVRLSLKEII